MSDNTTPDPIATPVVPRLASTLLVLREGRTDTEILMGRRSPQHRFMPNSLVFPGGAVDKEDYTATLGAPFPAHVERLIAKSAEPAIVTALGKSIARELKEETGLSLGNPPVLAHVDLLCRAITPSIRPRRFDAWFFTVSADHVGGAIAGSDELSEIRYFALREALAEDLEFATRGALTQLQSWLDLSHDHRRAREAIPTMREKIWYHE